MGEIVDLKKPEPLAYWHCGCGSSTFYVRTDRELECAYCESFVDLVGHWNIPATDEAPREATDEDPPEINRIQLGDDQASLDSIMRFTTEKGTEAVIVVRNDGTVDTWGTKFAGRAQRGWLRRKLDIARKMLVHG